MERRIGRSDASYAHVQKSVYTVRPASSRFWRAFARTADVINVSVLLQIAFVEILGDIGVFGNLVVQLLWLLCHFRWRHLSGGMSTKTAVACPVFSTLPLLNKNFEREDLRRNRSFSEGNTQVSRGRRAFSVAETAHQPPLPLGRRALQILCTAARCTTTTVQESHE